MKLLESILPILTTIDDVSIPATLLQGIYIAASQRKMEQFEGALRYEVRLLNRRIDAGKVAVSKEYVKSEAFSANVVQALRASEIADSEEKLKYIAKALANCTLEFTGSNINKNICMRILEQITVEEIDYLVSILKNPNISRKTLDIKRNGSFIESEETAHVSAGLVQMGLLAVAEPRWGAPPALRLSKLAEHLSLLCLTEADS